MYIINLIVSFSFWIEYYIPISHKNVVSDTYIYSPVRKGCLNKNNTNFSSKFLERRVYNLYQNTSSMFFQTATKINLKNLNKRPT